MGEEDKEIVKAKLIKKGWAFKTKVNKPGGGGDELYLYHHN